MREIAEAKAPDLNASSAEQAMSIIEGTARSMGYPGGRRVTTFGEPEE